MTKSSPEIFLPVKSVDDFFDDNEKDLMDGYKKYCREAGENVLLEDFLVWYWFDFYFEEPFNLN